MKIHKYKFHKMRIDWSWRLQYATFMMDRTRQKNKYKRQIIL